MGGRAGGGLPAGQMVIFSSADFGMKIPKAPKMIRRKDGVLMSTDLPSSCG